MVYTYIPHLPVSVSRSKYYNSGSSGWFFSVQGNRWQRGRPLVVQLINWHANTGNAPLTSAPPHLSCVYCPHRALCTYVLFGAPIGTPTTPSPPPPSSANRTPKLSLAPGQRNLFLPRRSVPFRRQQHYLSWRG